MWLSVYPDVCHPPWGGTGRRRQIAGRHQATGEPGTHSSGVNPSSDDDGRAIYFFPPEPVS
jgi:hypothetical protein